VSKNSSSVPDLDIKYLNRNFDLLYIGSSSSEDIELPFQITQKNFLYYAEYDLNKEYNHHLINSLSNIKRSIDCQLDCLLYRFGLLEKSRKEDWNFPKKIDCLNKIGVISPRILIKINQKRNLLEHEYIFPIKDDVIDAFDVAMLFIAYTEKFLKGTFSNFEVINEETDDYFDVLLDYKSYKLLFSKHDKKLIEIDIYNENYLEYLKWYVSIISK